jgi:2-polyprenyl-3-methyl-5-hydroxy-6-metoxy-1,4-benzoquinol methylase
MAKPGMSGSMSAGAAALPHDWDDNFVSYYARQSRSDKTLQRFTGIMGSVLRARVLAGLPTENLRIADIGCNAGTQSFLWAEAGHDVTGLDINEKLLAIARERSREHAMAISFEVGSATSLPWASESMDVCLLVELLEHVQDWESVLSEACRVLRKGGSLYVSTTNWLCPKQSEFELPMYSWYPAPLKRHYEQLAVTTRPELVNFTKYPAVHWFSPYGLAACLRGQGFMSFDRFDLIDDTAKSATQRLALSAIRNVPGFRFLAFLATPSSALVGIRQ